MKVLYDYSIFNMQKFGGISRYFVELMDNSPEELHWELPLLYSNNHYLLSNKVFNKIVPLPEEKEYPWYIEKTVRRGLRLTKRFLKVKPKHARIIESNKSDSIRAINNADYDIFHPTYYSDYILDLKIRRPMVLTVYDMIHEIYPEYFPLGDRTRKVKNELIKKADHIIAISESTKKDILSFIDIPEHKVSVIHLASSLNSEKLPIDNDEIIDLPEKYILYTGIRRGYKNFYFFSTVLATMMKENKDLKLLCTGPSFTDEEKNYFSILGIQDRVSHIYATDQQLKTLYKNALCFVFPTLYEGFGIPVLEAFTCECPALLSNVSSLPEVGGDAALYHDPKDALKLKKNINMILSSNDLRSELIEKGSKRAREFTWERTSKQTFELYKQILN